MNFPLLIIGLITISIFSFGARFLYRNLIEYKALLKKVKREGSFVYSRHYLRGLPQIKLPSEAKEDDQILSYRENLGLIKFDRFMKYFAYYLGMSLFLGIIIVMIFWIKAVAL